METIFFDKCKVEDLDIGDGTVDVRLQDQSIVTLNKINSTLIPPMARTRENLPPLGVPHRQIAVTNGQRGLWHENQDGTAWVPNNDTADCREWSIYPGASNLTGKLQQAVADCCAEGVRLYLPKGTYTLPQDFSFIGDATAFEMCGAGRGHTIITSSVPPTPGTQMWRFRNMDGLYIHDITFQGAPEPPWNNGNNRQGVTLEGCVRTVVERCEFVNAHALGLNISQYTTGNILSDYVSVRDCWAHHNNNQGFAAVAGRNLEFLNCYAYYNRLNGFDLEVNATVGSYVNHCSMSHCIAHNNGAAGFNVQGVQTYDAAKPAANYGQNAGWILMGNCAYNNGYGDVVPGDPEPPSPTSGIHVVDTNGAIIVGNVCRNNKVAGIHVEHGPHADGNGITFEDFLITNNICKSNDQYGILMQGDTPDFLQHWIVSNNILRLNGLRGLSADALTRYGFIAGNLIAYNTVANTNISSLAFTRGLGREQAAGDVNETARPRLPLPTDNTAVLPFQALGVTAGSTVAMSFAGGAMTSIPFATAGAAAVKLAVSLSAAPTGSTAFTVSLTVDGAVENFSCVVQGPSATKNQATQEITVASGTNWGAGQEIGLSVTASASAPTRDVKATLHVITFPNG